MRPLILFVALLAMLGCSRNTAPEPHQSVAGTWVGATGAVRVRVTLTETWMKEGFLAAYVISGNGALVAVATGESTPITVSGISQSGPTGVSMIFNLADAAGNPSPTGWNYGSFIGHLNAAGALDGKVDGSSPYATGPLHDTHVVAAPIVLLRQ